MNRKVIGIVAVCLAVIAVVILSRPSLASRRAAIERALHYDTQVAEHSKKHYFEKAGLLEVLGDAFGGNSQSSLDALSLCAARMRSTPLDGCPPEFKKAYRDHISAWESHDEQAIKDTWYRVKTVAFRYGVAPND